MSLADYLAKNYLTPDSKLEKRPKKRKRKEGAHSGLTIADDDASGWNTYGKGDADEDAPLTVNSASAEFRKTKANKWQTVGAPTPSSTEQSTADALIASAAAESLARAQADEDTPAIDGDDDDLAKNKMESGAHAGLQTAEQVTAQLERARAAERRRFLHESNEANGRGQETIYRDASGRIINVAMARAETRRKAADDAARSAAALEAARGDVQRAQREQQRDDLDQARFLPLARYADDVGMNEEMRERERWNDPARQFLTGKKEGKSVSGKPLYSGAAMPNRYGIRPGYRWDGVDRGNGFEKEFFAAQNRRRNLKELDYAWQMDE